MPFPFGCGVCLTHTSHRIKPAGRTAGPALTVRLATPLIGAVSCFSLGGGAEAAGGSWSMPVPPHRGGPGAPACRRGVDRLAQPPQRCPFLTQARVYEHLAMAQSWRSELSHRVGGGVSVLTLLAGSRSHKPERGCGSRDWPLQREKQTCLPVQLCPPD